jgi:hypothetical protein
VPIAALLKALCIALILLLLNGCIVVPQTVSTYNTGCELVSRRVELKPVQVQVIERCEGSECGLLLAGYGVVAAASVVVSGSIAVAGNVVFWLEEQGRCVRKPA